MTPIISADSIDASYGEAQALFDISIAADEGELVALIGRNGAGKTTTLRCLSGLLAPDSGTVHVSGEDMTGREPHEFVDMGVSLCPEDRKLFPEMSVLENLQVGSHAARATFENNLETVFEYFPVLEERREQSAGTLSGGEQQMLTISRSLMNDPEVLLLDEPSEGLAPQLVDRMFETIERLNAEEELTIVLVEQNAQKTLDIADHGYLIKNGEIVLSGTGAELKNSDSINEVYLGTSSE
jgi:branched-chain amino acid transport system ATP-binding protein